MKANETEWLSGKPKEANPWSFSQISSAAAPLIPFPAIPA